MLEYKVWASMKSRCHDSSREGYQNYGGRGIRVCKRWLESFDAFLEDMGPRQSGRHSIDRIDPNGHYEPGNCLWVTGEVQANNTRRSVRLEHEGVVRTAAQWGREWCLCAAVVAKRIDLGWDAERIRTTPVRGLTRNGG